MLFGLIIAESQGREKVESPAGAVGFLQLMEDKAREIGLEVSDEVDEREDAGKVLECASAAIKKNYDRYGDWGLALWEWHMGSGNMYALLAEYYGPDFPEENYRSFIEKSKLNVHTLLKSSQAKEFFATGNWDNTDDYIYNIVAGVAIYRNYFKNK